MRDLDWVECFGEVLKHLEEEFKEDELAYLALTSKAEKQIVDRIAFRLHRDYSGGRWNVAIAREFTIPKEIQRVDIAIIQGGIPRVLCEAKSMHAFDVNLAGGIRKYQKRLEKDIEKLKAFRPRNPQDNVKKILLHLTTHIAPSDPDERWNGIIKYSSKIRKHSPNSLDELRVKLNDQLQNNIFPLIMCGDIPGGCAFDMG